MTRPVRTGLALAGAAALVTAAIAAPASAAPSNKGTTTVAPAFPVLGVLAPGYLGSGGAVFGIVGNPSKGDIKHVGGVVIDGSKGITKDADLEIRNFWIGNGQVTGEVEGVGRASLFTLANVQVNGNTITATLKFTATASAAIGANVTGQDAGTATVVLK